MAASETKVKLKLLVDKKSKKVIFAEASKEFVDFLFSLMSLPLGAIVSLLKKDEGMVGSIGDLYDSIESLSQTYRQSNQNVETILNPKPSVFGLENPLLLCDSKIISRKAYMCPHAEQSRHGYGCGNSPPTYHPYVADDPNTPCPSCERPMRNELDFVVPPASGKQEAGSGGGGFVKGVVTYMVMDNLEVKPMSTISSITLINSINIKDLGSLQEEAVDVGVSEGLKMLRASMTSKNVLTEVFLSNQGAE